MPGSPMIGPMLVIFDIDGTLTTTNGFDARCSSRAFREVFGVSLPTTDWSRYRTSTDSGIITEAIRMTHGREVTPAELESFERVFLRELTEGYAQEPESIFPVPGAVDLMTTLRAADHAVGLATGGMKSTALFKLASAGFKVEGWPAAFANDSIERAEIIGRVLKIASASPEDAVYVGDAPWDARAAAMLGMRFIGVTCDSSERKLREAGVSAWIPDYTDAEAFLSALDRALPPPPSPRDSDAD